MTTSLTDDTRREAWSAPRDVPDSGSLLTRAEWLWTLVGLALLAAFLLLLVDDYALPILQVAH
jgi:hypothetical protein